MRLLYYISKNDFNRVFQAVFTVLETPYIYPLKREKTQKFIEEKKISHGATEKNKEN